MQLFSLYVCGDIGTGEKCNFELAFNGRPTMEELHARVVEAFTVAKHHLNPRDSSFCLSRFAIYDAQEDYWRELDDEAQLAPWSQLYAQTPHGNDVPQALPTPVLPPHALPPTAAPVRQSRATPTRSIILGGQASPRVSRPAPSVAYRSLVLEPPTTPVEPHRGHQKFAPPFSSMAPETSTAARLFHLIDRDCDGVISLRELREAMLCNEMDVSEASVGDTFSWGDHQVTAGEFRGFQSAYPAIVSELLRRMERDIQTRQEAQPHSTTRATDLSVLNSSEQRSSVPRPVPPIASSPMPAPAFGGGDESFRRPQERSEFPASHPSWHSGSSSAAEASLAHREAALLRELDMVRRERALLGELRRRDHSY